jgi:hypothetical protein
MEKRHGLKRAQNDEVDRDKVTKKAVSFSMKDDPYACFIIRTTVRLQASDESTSDDDDESSKWPTTYDIMWTQYELYRLLMTNAPRGTYSRSLH